MAMDVSSPLVAYRNTREKEKYTVIMLNVSMPVVPIKCSNVISKDDGFLLPYESEMYLVTVQDKVGNKLYVNSQGTLNNPLQ